MARVLHGMSVDTLPEISGLKSEDQLIVYRESDGMAYRINASSVSLYSMMAYPVGSVYMSVNNVNPASLIGGTWEKLETVSSLSAGNNETYMWQRTA